MSKAKILKESMKLHRNLHRAIGSTSFSGSPFGKKRDCKNRLLVFGKGMGVFMGIFWNFN